MKASLHYVSFLVILAGVLPAQEKQPVAKGSPPTPAVVTFADNGQQLGTGDSWYIQLIDINGDG